MRSGVLEGVEKLIVRVLVAKAVKAKAIYNGFRDSLLCLSGLCQVDTGLYSSIDMESATSDAEMRKKCLRRGRRRYATLRVRASSVGHLLVDNIEALCAAALCAYDRGGLNCYYTLQHIGLTVR